MDTEQKDAYTCPSFNSYSSLAQVAAKAAAGGPSAAARIGSHDGGDDDDDDFEFAPVRDGGEISPLDFAGDAQNGTLFPLFNPDLLPDEEKQPESRVAAPLSKLFAEGRGENPASCSSSEADEPEDFPAGAYCAWHPSPGRCRKSSSTGSALRRWSIRNLLRSSSEGKGKFDILAQKNREDRLPVEETNRKGARSAHEALYLQNREAAEGNKKKSYLPYRRDIVGFFVNVDGLGKGFPRF
ncbi:Protein of unknown function (DUF1645 [Striga hermonthica]|uniref:Uncharacterized protein n=1 Tax=Striga hermonthica TaxID=68872 RepID=A0A9N7RF35_STRHE|nr:Protein of unknown function (DUF1645 [Striga hermonthica]